MGRLRELVGRAQPAAPSPTSGTSPETQQGGRAGAASVETSAAAAGELSAQADRLVEDGRVLDAIGLLAAAYREAGAPADAIRLVDLRHDAFETLDPGAGRTPWPPDYDDPFPEVSGTIPEVDGADLTARVLGGAVAHHGALVVRGLFDGDQVERSLHVIKT